MLKNRTFAVLLGLFVLTVAEVASAQQVVVLEFAGDKKGKLRGQVVAALTKARRVDLVPLKAYEAAAAKRKFKGPRAMTPTAVAAVSQILPFDAAVEGAVADTFFVRILDGDGQELWSRELPVRKGMLSNDNANRLAKAIAAAASTAQNAEPAAAPSADETASTDESTEPPVVAETPTVRRGKTEESSEGMGLDLSGGDESSSSSSSSSDEGKGSDDSSSDDSDETARAVVKPLTEEERERRRQAELAESQSSSERESARVEVTETDEDLDQERKRRKRGPGPKMIEVEVAWLTTWRAYCSRPGVTSCSQYDGLAEEDQPAGDRVDVLPKRPYGGFGLGVEFFPLASSAGPVNGLGIVGNFSQAFSQTRVSVITESGEAGEPKIVVSRDAAFQAAATYRYYFGIGQDRLAGYVGARGGYHGRSFEVDRNETTSLPGASRGYPALGLDASFPLASYARLEAGGTYFLNPRPGTQEVEGYGQTATGSGFQFEAGMSGDVWGPLGYVARFRVIDYHDQFQGEGNKWSEGGTAQETYTHLFVGATASF